MVSSWVPPMAGGAPVMLGRLLDQFSNTSYAVLTERRAAFTGLPREGWLPAPHYFRDTQPELFPVEPGGPAPPADARATHRRPKRGILAGAISRLSDLNLSADVRDLTRVAQFAIERENLEIVLVTSSDPVFMVAAARAARFANRDMYVHLFDLFAGNRYSLLKRVLASRNERKTLRDARYVFVPNEAMASHYRDRLGINPILIPNGTLIPPLGPIRPVSANPTILYTGAVYWAQLDALKNLVVAMRDLPGVRFRVRTNASAYHLNRAGLRPEHLLDGFSSQDAALSAQREADILFLPLAFRTSAPAVMRTALPAKTAEYLVSGTPILVHAPPDAHISQYARAVGWGYVVDQPDSNALARAVRKLLGDAQLRADLVSTAYQEAVRAHDLRKIVGEYGRYFS